jgi:hypothetical protein
MQQTEQLERLAKVAVEYVRGFHVQSHRAVYREGLHDLQSSDYVIAFGNDEYKEDKQTQEQVQLLLEHLNGKEQLKQHRYAFAVSEDGYSWAIIIEDFERAIDVEQLNNTLWAIFKQVRGL